MNKRIRRYTFTVRGTGEFPQDMLRYDACTPLTDDDKRIVYAEYSDDILWDNETQRLRLNTVRLVTERRFITNARWRSFLWSVVEEPTFLNDKFTEPPKVIIDG